MWIVVADTADVTPYRALVAELATAHRVPTMFPFRGDIEFILGLPGETKETIEETIRFAAEINPHTIQVSLAAPYPGTFLHRQALENGWLADTDAELLTEQGTQIAQLSYPHLSHTEIFNSVEEFYRRFYFRAGKIASIVGEMIKSPQMMKRRLR